MSSLLRRERHEPLVDSQNVRLGGQCRNCLPPCWNWLWLIAGWRIVRSKLIVGVETKDASQVTGRKMCGPLTHGLLT